MTEEPCRRCHGTKIITTPYIDSIVYCLYECWECKNTEEDVSCGEEESVEDKTRGEVSYLQHPVLQSRTYKTDKNETEK